MQIFPHTDEAAPQQRDVTLLFADLRGFTELAASLGSDPLVCELLAHVMDCLTDAVIDRAGTIVDYYGDGLVAMWNAPADQHDHAARACDAAFQMLETLPAVSADWKSVTDTELRLGVGLHTGETHVGNAGSKHVKKYGPRGPNVHMAKRVEAATKELSLPLLATDSTVEQLPNRFSAHRVCRAQMPGMQQPVDLFAVCLSREDAGCVAGWRAYDKALTAFEQGDFDAAARILATLDITKHEMPTQFLAEKTQNELGRKLRRRSSDSPIIFPAGVISISAK